MTRPLDSNDAELQETPEDALALYSQSIRDFTMGLYAQSLRATEDRLHSESHAPESAVKKKPAPGKAEDVGLGNQR